MPWISWLITVFWIVIVTVAINFIDGLDGLAAGISAIACGVIAVIAADNQESLLIVPALALLGSLTGFLFFNFNAAKIFMGDCGACSFGFAIAVTSIKCNAKTGTVMGLALPALALGIPLLDTLFTMIRRGVLEECPLFRRKGRRPQKHRRRIIVNSVSSSGIPSASAGSAKPITVPVLALHLMLVTAIAKPMNMLRSRP